MSTDPPIDSDVPFVEEGTTGLRPLWPDGLTAMPATDVESHNLAYAGARPADRTGNDERIVQEITDRAGNDRLDSPYDYWIPDHNAVGGYPSLPENTHSLSVPSRDLRDWLEQWAQAVEEASASPPQSSSGFSTERVPVRATPSERVVTRSLASRDVSPTFG